MPSSKSSPRPLPARPDLLQLKKQARSLHKAVRGGSSEAFARVAGQHPRVAAAGAAHTAHCQLSDAQLTIAREHGFPSWPALVAPRALRRNIEKKRPFRKRALGPSNSSSHWHCSRGVYPGSRSQSSIGCVKLGIGGS